MAYPNAEDYLRAVQHPQRVFRVPALRTAVFEPHPVFGIPMPASGNAAVVFRAGVGGQDTALRFFIRPDASTRDRYAALDRHFAGHGIGDCVARAAWIDDAIAVNGATWPVVSMSWVDGRTLDAYVSHLVSTSNAAALAQLAEEWRGLIGRLQSAGFAHGDLQHGNVLIDRASALRLVDFDGSWIAVFRDGPPPNETGHPNYQRTGREWGRWMDTFPGLVVYTALLALSRRPQAWTSLHNGENMLFRAEDFDPPFRTRAWQAIAGIGDGQVDLAAERLMRACDPAWRAAGSLEALLGVRPVVRVPTGGGPVRPPFAGVAGSDRAPWWELTAMPSGGGPAPAASQPAPAAASQPVPAASQPVPAAADQPVPAAADQRPVEHRVPMPAPPPKQQGAGPAAERPRFAGATGSSAWYPPAAGSPNRPSYWSTPPTAGATGPGGSRPGGSRPGGSRPGGSRPGGSQPGGSQPGGSRPGGSQPGGQAALAAVLIGLIILIGLIVLVIVAG
jgi:eukaryotic-like serine/threonine-protein kinase